MNFNSKLSLLDNAPSQYSFDTGTITQSSNEESDEILMLATSTVTPNILPIPDGFDSSAPSVAPSSFPALETSVISKTNAADILSSQSSPELIGVVNNVNNKSPLDSQLKTKNNTHSLKRRRSISDKTENYSGTDLGYSGIDGERSSKFARLSSNSLPPHLPQSSTATTTIPQALNLLNETSFSTNLSISLDKQFDFIAPSQIPFMREGSSSITPLPQISNDTSSLINLDDGRDQSFIVAQNILNLDTDFSKPSQSVSGATYESPAHFSLLNDVIPMQTAVLPFDQSLQIPSSLATSSSNQNLNLQSPFKLESILEDFLSQSFELATNQNAPLLQFLPNAPLISPSNVVAPTQSTASSNPMASTQSMIASNPTVLNQQIYCSKSVTPVQPIIPVKSPEASSSSVSLEESISTKQELSSYSLPYENTTSLPTSTIVTPTDSIKEIKLVDSEDSVNPKVPAESETTLPNNLSCDKPTENEIKDEESILKASFLTLMDIMSKIQIHQQLHKYNPYSAILNSIYQNNPVGKQKMLKRVEDQVLQLRKEILNNFDFEDQAILAEASINFNFHVPMNTGEILHKETLGEKIESVANLQTKLLNFPLGSLLELQPYFEIESLKNQADESTDAVDVEASNATEANEAQNESYIAYQPLDLETFLENHSTP